MRDSDFIKKHFDSFVDDVLLDFDKDWWANMLGSDPWDDAAGYLHDGLYSKMRNWRVRVEETEQQKALEAGQKEIHEWWMAQDADDAWAAQFEDMDK